MLVGQVGVGGDKLVFAAPIAALHVLSVDTLWFSATNLFSSFRISQLSMLVLRLACI